MFAKSVYNLKTLCGWLNAQRNLFPFYNETSKSKTLNWINCLYFGLHYPLNHLNTNLLQQPTMRNKKERSAKYFPKENKPSKANVDEQLTLLTVIRGHQIRGHLAASIDPLGVKTQKNPIPEFPARIILRQNRVPVDKEKQYLVPNHTFVESGPHMLLGDIIQSLSDMYCDTMGTEYMYDPLNQPRDWLNDELENTDPVVKLGLTPECRIDILRRLVAIESLEIFFKDKLPKEIRLSVCGAESGILAVQELIQRACNVGGDTFIIGMRRTGRLSTLANVLQKPLHEIFTMITPEDRGLSKYNCGAYSEIKLPGNNTGVARVSLCATSVIPEIFYPLTLGWVKGLQIHEYDGVDGRRIWPVMIHGIRELHAQGIAYETLKLSRTHDFSGFGTIQIILGTRPDYNLEENSAVGNFYCSDVMKIINAPVLHVNCDDVEKVISAVDTAVKYRRKFKRTIALHIVGYNRWLHQLPPCTYNQQIWHNAIKVVDPVTRQYAKKLIKLKILTESDFEKIIEEEKAKITYAWKKTVTESLRFDHTKWSDVVPSVSETALIVDRSSKHPLITGCNKDRLLDLATRLSTEPVGFNLCSADDIAFKQRSKMVDADALDWILCEYLAFATLLQDGISIRICGRNINRRRLILQECTDDVNPNSLNLIASLFKLSSTRFSVVDKVESIFGSFAFHVGFSLGDPSTLVIWEAPVGDKVSKIQPIMDAYVSMFKPKFRKSCGIVMYIPHGFKCENSFTACNGRPERILQSCTDDESEVMYGMSQQFKEINMIVINPSTGANLFHALRRHLRLPSRTPLIIYIPQDITKTPTEFKSTLDDLAESTKFIMVVYDSSIINVKKVRKILFCTGRIYIDLVTERLKKKLTDQVAIFRLEQICPFPYTAISEEMERYHFYESLCWVQEEPRNQGWWAYIGPRLKRACGGVKDIEVVARNPSPDSGIKFKQKCIKEKEEIIRKALNLSFG